MCDAMQGVTTQGRSSMIILVLLLLCVLAHSARRALVDGWLDQPRTHETDQSIIRGSG